MGVKDVQLLSATTGAAPLHADADGVVRAKVVVRVTAPVAFVRIMVALRGAARAGRADSAPAFGACARRVWAANALADAVAELVVHDPLPARVRALADPFPLVVGNFGAPGSPRSTVELDALVLRSSPVARLALARKLRAAAASSKSHAAVSAPAAPAAAAAAASARRDAAHDLGVRSAFSGQIQCSLSVPRRAVLPGDTITCTLHCRPALNRTIASATLQLIRVLEWESDDYGTMGNDDRPYVIVSCTDDTLGTDLGLPDHDAPASPRSDVGPDGSPSGLSAPRCRLCGLPSQDACAWPGHDAVAHSAAGSAACKGHPKSEWPIKRTFSITVPHDVSPTLELGYISHRFVLRMSVSVLSPNQQRDPAEHLQRIHNQRTSMSASRSSFSGQRNSFSANGNVPSRQSLSDSPPFASPPSLTASVSTHPTLSLSAPSSAASLAAIAPWTVANSHMPPSSPLATSPPMFSPQRSLSASSTSSLSSMSPSSTHAMPSNLASALGFSTSPQHQHPPPPFLLSAAANAVATAAAKAIGSDSRRGSDARRGSTASALSFGSTPAAASLFAGQHHAAAAPRERELELAAVLEIPLLVIARGIDQLRPTAVPALPRGLAAPDASLLVPQLVERVLAQRAFKVLYHPPEEDPFRRRGTAADGSGGDHDGLLVVHPGASVHVEWVAALCGRVPHVSVRLAC
ncbi:hypothetical protein HK105_204621 [Polyrhizophydium stewartii]|uniref:Arrestin C-terminal-like domain-containing protein n=1 Tax=Polyrhizophydium stewartii TaxID=2732419 RepID=A0ABR4N8S3_9FUNG